MRATAVAIVLFGLIGSFLGTLTHAHEDRDDASRRLVDLDSYSDDVKEFKKRAHIKPDANLDLQQVSGEVFTMKGMVVSFADADLEPVHKDMPNPTLFEAQLVVDTIFGTHVDDTYRVLVTKRNNMLKGAVAINKGDGGTTELFHIKDSVFVTVESDDLDVESLGMFEFGSTNHAGNRLLSKKNHLRRNKRKLQTACTSFQEIRISLHFDSGFCAMHNNVKADAIAHLEQVIELVSNSYDDDGLCIKVRACQIVGFCNGQSGDDELRDLVLADGVVFCDIGDNELSAKFGEYVFPGFSFPGKLPAGQCDVAHLIFGNNKQNQPPFNTKVAGCASIGALCNPFASGADYFAVSPLPSVQARTLAHELGHNCNAQHLTTGNFIMRDTLCVCDAFGPTSAAVISSFVDSVDDGNCIGEVSASSPTSAPSRSPSTFPTSTPIDLPNPMPSQGPTTSSLPSTSPISGPVLGPTSSPTISASPSNSPTSSPTKSSMPSTSPISAPVFDPTSTPTVSPAPSAKPSASPILFSYPSSEPSAKSMPSGRPINDGNTKRSSSSSSMDSDRSSRHSKPRNNNKPSPTRCSCYARSSDCKRHSPVCQWNAALRSCMLAAPIKTKTTANIIKLITKTDDSRGIGSKTTKKNN